ncbi:MAG: hypothetical protein QM820_54350 [Minicystis sp.]
MNIEVPRRNGARVLVSRDMKAVRASHLAVGVLSLSIVFAACSAAPGSQATGGGSSNGAGGDDISIDAGPGADAGENWACATQRTTAERLPIDIFLMLDHSGSMSLPAGQDTRWGAVTKAIEAFVSQPSPTNISVGLQYFPLDAPAESCAATCTTDADCGEYGPCLSGFFYCIGCPGGTTSSSCVVNSYAMPDVEIAPLPGAAAGILVSLAGHQPDGSSTPTGPALAGALAHAKAWAIAHPDHVVVNVLATDGEPTACAPTDIGAIADIAADGAKGSPEVRTYVIGIGDDNVSALDEIAAAGGTDSAILVTDEDAQASFFAALDAVRGVPLGCSYPIPVPEGGLSDFDRVNVQYTPGGGGALQTFPRVDGVTACSTYLDGWYYDDPSAPTTILLCYPSCNKVSYDKTGEVDIVLGCQTIVR